jgi:transposase
MELEQSDSGEISFSSEEESGYQEDEKEDDEYTLSEGETEEPFSKLVVLNTLKGSDLDFYNEQEYINYVLKDLNQIRTQNKIPERDLNNKFSLFREKDFLDEYKTMYFNTHQKELLDQKYLIACDFMAREAKNQRNDFIEFERDPNQILADLRQKKEEEIQNLDGITSIFNKIEHINHYRKTKKIRIANEVRREKKISKKPRKLEEKKHANFVKELVKQNTEKGKKTTAREVGIALQQNFSINKLGLTCVRNFMKKYCRLSYKKAKMVKVGESAMPTTSEDLLKRFIVGQHMLDIFEFFEVIFIDECYFHSKTPFHSWGPKGESLDILAPKNGQFKIGVCAAISKKKFLGYQLLNNTRADKHMFKKFLEGLFTRLSPQEYRKKIVIFLDNSSVHRAKLIQNFCQEYQIKVIFNAPYCPDFNPIENLFCLWKGKVHEQVHNNKAELINSILTMSLGIAFDRKKDYITSFVLRSLYFWKTYSDCQITDFLDLGVAQNIIHVKKKQRKLRKERRNLRKFRRNQSSN